MSRVTPLHVNYQAYFLRLIFALSYLFELSCPFSPLYNTSALKNKEHFFMQFEISEAHIIRIGPKFKYLWRAKGDEGACTKYVSDTSELLWNKSFVVLP